MLRYESFFSLSEYFETLCHDYDSLLESEWTECCCCVVLIQQDGPHAWCHGAPSQVRLRPLAAMAHGASMGADHLLSPQTLSQQCFLLSLVAFLVVVFVLIVVAFSSLATLLLFVFFVLLVIGVFGGFLAHHLFESRAQ